MSLRASAGSPMTRSGVRDLAIAISVEHIGAPLMGWLSDRLGRRKPLILAGCVMMTLATAAVVYLPGLPGAASAALLILGSLFASTMVLTFALCRDHFPPEHSGAAYGFGNTATVGSGAGLQPLIGILIDLAWDGQTAGGIRLYTLEAYRSAFLVLPAVGVGGLLAALFLTETGRRR